MYNETNLLFAIVVVKLDLIPNVVFEVATTHGESVFFAAADAAVECPKLVSNQKILVS